MMNLTAPAILADHAVLQRDRPIPLHGTGVPKTIVRVEFRHRQWRTRSDANGHWHVTMDPLTAGGPDDLTIRTGRAPACVLHDLLVGEVWVCSGQSNMEMALADTETGPADARRSQDDGLRLLTIPRGSSLKPCAAIPGTAWTASAPPTSSTFSAMAFYFGQHLRKRLKIPIGLINASVGATPGESWMSHAALAAEADFKPIFERWQRSLAIFPDPDRTVEAAFRQWDRDTDLAEREGRPIPGAHPKLIGPDHAWTPSGLFNAMINPLVTYPLRGVIWAQGAAAPERAYEYRTLFRALIRDWRQAWGQDRLPFLFVQEAAFGPRRTEPGEHSWAELREAQAMALALPDTGMAVSIDAGDAQDIHPKRKRPVGDRLALAARALVYGEDIPWSGPVFRSMQMEGSKIRLRFYHVHGGLRTSDGKCLRGFAVSGGATNVDAGNRGFYWAKACIEGEEVVVSSEEVSAPVTVRYAWAQNPDCNLVNAAGLPAAPFRTDPWPGLTMSNF